jgi:hypothetical protein
VLFLSIEARRTMRERRKEKQRMLDLGPLIPMISDPDLLYSPRRNFSGNTIMSGNYYERRILQVSDKTFLKDFCEKLRQAISYRGADIAGPISSDLPKSPEKTHAISQFLAQILPVLISPNVPISPYFCEISFKDYFRAS